MQRLRRPSAATALATLATAVALASALHAGPDMWRALDRERRVYADYTETERERASVEEHHALSRRRVDGGLAARPR